MANIPLGVIIMWAGNNADIPSGWERETSLDGKYPKGNASGIDPDLTGGSNTHTHTSLAHGHSITAHVHSVSLNASTAGGNNTGKTSSGGPADNHGHNAVNSGAVSGGSLSSVASTYGSVASEPPYHEVIFIKPTYPANGIPVNGIAFWDNSNIKSGFYLCNGSNSTPNLTDKFLKGAGTGANAGGTGGSSTHTGHTITHTHTETGHTHARVQSGSYTNTTNFETASGTADTVQSHSHDIDLNSKTISYGGTPVSGSANNEPAYKKLLAIQNRTANQLVTTGLIALWLGNLDDIPPNWSYVTAMNDKHLKITNTAGDVYKTGGSNTHTHSDSHTHTGSSHNHTATIEYQTQTNNCINSDHKLPKPHTHTANVGNASASWQSTNTTGASSSNEPTYRTVTFIKLDSLQHSNFMFI